MNDIPVIDISSMSSERVEERRAVAATMGAACRGPGFFLIIGHGVAPGIVEGAFAAARTYFGQPLATKLELEMTAATGNRGYAGLEVERLNERAADLKEAFNIGLDLGPDDPQILAKKPFRAVNLWPGLPGWRAAALAYYDNCMRVSRLLHRGFALDLGIAEGFFDDKVDQPIATLRMLHYPPAPAAATDQPGAGEHTDYGTMTILRIEDAPGGLQVRTREGAWIDVGAVPDAFVVNIGDLMMRWTNDRWISTLHRVANPPREAGSAAGRISLAFFHQPNYDALIECLPGCESAGNPAKYPPVLSGEHRNRKFAATTVAH